MPKLFRLTKGGKLNAGIFEGATINTLSMLAVEDMLGAGLGRKHQRRRGPDCAGDANFAVLMPAQATDWIDWLADDPATRSTIHVSEDRRSGVSRSMTPHRPPRLW